MIFCLRLKDNVYFVQNSSHLIIQIEFDFFEEFQKKVQAEILFSDEKIKVNGESSQFNLVVPIKNGGEFFVFFILGKRSVNLINVLPVARDRYFLSPFLVPFFSQLSNFFLNEYRLRQSRVKKIDEIKGEYDYVLRTINAVHFIRNRLTPFKNYLEMTSDMYKPNTYNEDVKKRLENVISEENERSQSTLREIFARAKQILEEGDNPFNVTKDITFIELRIIFNDLQSLLFDIMGNASIEKGFKPQDLLRKINISHKGISIILSDIVGNIKKHSNGNFNVFFVVNNENLFIKFNNNFVSDSSTIKKLRELHDYFASDENYNIFKMSSKGAFLIKDFSRQMNIQVNAEVDEVKFNFCIELKINISL
jgi:hypothetical protein